MNSSTASTTNTKIAIGFTAVIVLLIIAFTISALLQKQDAPDVAADPATIPPSAIADDSHFLDDIPGAEVTVVEFLDFECEACGAFYPYVEDIREKYSGQINYVIRYFPLPGHGNSQNAAVAVEAAARQGQLEAMYNQMFITQGEWGESQESKADVFRGFAEQLGLDMAAYDADVADPTTLQRVTADLDAGRALGITSTPTFFVNNRYLQMSAYEDLEAAIVEELEQ